MLKTLKKSFTIIELSIVISVIAVLSSISFFGAKAILNMAKTTKNKQKMELVQQKLNDFFKTNGRLPKPADYLVLKTAENYGKEKVIKSSYDVDVDADFYSYLPEHYDANGQFIETQDVKKQVNYIMYKGIIPFKDLNLLEQDVVDEYGNYIEYYVPDIMTIDDGNLPYSQESLVKDKYLPKNQQYGTYLNYPCFGLHNNSIPPSTMCLEDKNSIYGVNFIDADYIPVEFIRLESKDQKIDLGIQPSSNMKIIMKYTYENCSTTQSPIISILSDGYNFSFLCYDDNEFGAITQFNFSGNSISTQSQDEYIKLTNENENVDIYETKLLIKNKTMSIVPIDDRNGFVSKEITEFTDTINENIYLLGASISNIYYIKIYKDNKLVGDFIPVYLTRDIEAEKSFYNTTCHKNEVGLWNLITNKFHQEIGQSESLNSLQNANKIGKKIDYDLSLNLIHYIQPPYGLRVKNIKNKIDYKKNGELAYVLVSHGKNGAKTCGIEYHEKNEQNKTHNFFNYQSLSVDDVAEAQNCIDAQETNEVVGRADFMKNIDKEFIFYKGEESNSFDDTIYTETLSNLILSKNN